MPAAFAASDAAVVASVEPEAFGRTATEAQAMGCPVIATAIGAPPETVLAEPAVNFSEATGWLVKPGDAGELSRALTQLLGMSDEAVKAMAFRARQRVSERFSLESMKKQTLSVYDRLLSENLEAAFVRRNRS